MSQEIEVKVDLRFDIDITEVSPGQRNEDGITEIVKDVLDSCVYDIPGAKLTRIGVSIEGID
jgi:hypothetical protein|tara:strand:+ start:1266 stop:1451 length:186 start_codon:yes stop_codon:yes gene_type:complete